MATTLRHILAKDVVREVRVIVFNATFNNISIISWRSVLLVEETGVPGVKPTCCKSMTKNWELYGPKSAPPQTSIKLSPKCLKICIIIQ
jgi:hypothetical protein